MIFYQKISKLKRDQNEFSVVGDIGNENSILAKNFLNLLRLRYEDINISNAEISSKNKFSFIIDNKFKYKDLFIDSEITLDKAEYEKPKLLNEYFSEVKNVINLKKHKIKACI